MKPTEFVQVERAFTLFSLGLIVAERDKQGRSVLKISKTMNRDTGVESSKRFSFGEASWGNATYYYLRSIDKLRPDRFNKIIALANQYTKSASQKGNRGDLDDADKHEEEDDDERANLVDLSSDQGERRSLTVI